MILQEHLDAWRETAPWTESKQVEQDLIISRAIVEIFNDVFLREELRFRGGTALNKLNLAGANCRGVPGGEDMGQTKGWRRRPEGAFAHFVMRLPGEPWKKTEAMAERYGVALG